MFPELRRKDRKIGDEAAKEILHQGEYGVLSMACPSGYGYGIPLSYVYLDNALYFHCAHDGYKMDIIKANNKVSFCVVGESVTLPDKFSVKYSSVIVFGRAMEVFDGEKEAALLGLVAKYSSGFTEAGKDMIRDEWENTAVMKISIEQMCGKARKN